MWLQLAIVIVALVVSYAMQPKPIKPKPAALDEIDMPTAEEGRPAAVIFGDCWVEDPNVLWFGDLSTKPIKSESGK